MKRFLGEDWLKGYGYIAAFFGITTPWIIGMTTMFESMGLSYDKSFNLAMSLCVGTLVVIGLKFIGIFSINKHPIQRVLYEEAVGPDMISPTFVILSDEINGYAALLVSEKAIGKPREVEVLKWFSKYGNPTAQD